MTGDKQKQKPSSKISNTYINKLDKKAATPYLIKKKKNGKVIAIKANKQANKGKGAKHIWVPKEIISTMKSTKTVGSKREVTSPMNNKEFGDLAKMGCISWDTSYWINFIAKWISEYFGPKFPHP
jgi:hypothetical protein